MSVILFIASSPASFTSSFDQSSACFACVLQGLPAVVPGRRRTAALLGSSPNCLAARESKRPYAPPERPAILRKAISAGASRFFLEREDRRLQFLCRLRRCTNGSRLSSNSLQALLAKHESADLGFQRLTLCVGQTRLIWVQPARTTFATSRRDDRVRHPVGCEHFLGPSAAEQDKLQAERSDHASLADHVPRQPARQLPGDGSRSRRAKISLPPPAPRAAANRSTQRYGP